MPVTIQSNIVLPSRSEARFYSLLCAWSHCKDPLRFIWQVINSRPAIEGARPSLWLVPSARLTGKFYKSMLKRDLAPVMDFASGIIAHIFVWLIARLS